MKIGIYSVLDDSERKLWKLASLLYRNAARIVGDSVVGKIDDSVTLHMEVFEQLCPDYFQLSYVSDALRMEGER